MTYNKYMLSSVAAWAGDARYLYCNKADDTNYPCRHKRKPKLVNKGNLLELLRTSENDTHRCCCVGDDEGHDSEG
jgi:hypothetical protein